MCVCVCVGGWAGGRAGGRACVRACICVYMSKIADSALHNLGPKSTSCLLPDLFS